MADRTCSVPGCGKPYRARGLCSTHYNVANAKPVVMTCAACGVDVVKDQKYSRRVVCSTECRAYLQNGPAKCAVPDTHPSRSTRVPFTHPCRKPQPVVSGSCRVFLPDCAVCGLVFASPYTVSTCSPACAEVKRVDDKREQRHKRRAVKRGAFVAPVSRRAIYERDRYRCHLCKRKVMVDKPVPHPRAAVLDHVIPLAVGGTHEPANVRTACFMCNCLKGAGGGGEQLMLIG